MTNAAKSGPITGQPLNRVDGHLKVTGAAQYAAEIPVEGVAYAVIVGAGVAKGKVKSLDASRAEQVPGVLAVVTSKNVGKVLQPGKSSDGGTDRVLQLLQNDDVLYSGQPIAVVVADTFERARDAGQLLVIGYDSVPPEASLQTAAAKSTFVPGKKEQSEVGRGDADGALAKAEVTIDQTYNVPTETHNPMEMHATIAVWQGDKKLTLYDSTQGVFECRRKIGQTLGIEPDNVRVISHYVGGGFGSKGSVWSHVALAAIAAKHVQKPVKLVLTRQQMFDFVGHRPETSHAIKLGATKGGVLTAIRHDLLTCTSSFDNFVERSIAPTLEIYACPNVATTIKQTRLDTGTPTFMRAPGESTGSFAMESAMDELSYAIGLDPIALRLSNSTDVNPQSNKPWTTKSLRQCYALGAQKFGWSKRKATPGATKDGDVLVGYGMATASYPAHVHGASAMARLSSDGRALVQAGSQDIGTGTYTVMTQIACDALGLQMDKVKFELGDTQMPETPTSGGSMTAGAVGSAVKVCCEMLRDKVIAAAVADSASPLSGADPKNVVIQNGVLLVKGTMGKSEPLADFVKRQPNGEIEVKNTLKLELKGFDGRSFGAQFAEVHVDPMLGTVRVSRMLGVFAAGKILNAKTARSQFLGGMVWGVGMALFEHAALDPRSGRFVTRDLADYHVAVNADIGDFDALFVPEDDARINPAGVKGIGEIGITGAAAAVANAVYNATGKRVRDLPITPDKLLL